MKYRPQRGSLTDAMAECVVIEPTMAALRSHIAETNESVFPESVEVKPYMGGPDSRIGWERTFIVIAKWIDGNRGPIGYTDRMPAGEMAG